MGPRAALARALAADDRARCPAGGLRLATTGGRGAGARDLARGDGFPGHPVDAPAPRPWRGDARAVASGGDACPQVVDGALIGTLLAGAGGGRRTGDREEQGDTEDE